MKKSEAGRWQFQFYLSCLGTEVSRKASEKTKLLLLNPSLEAGPVRHSLCDQFSLFFLKISCLLEESVSPQGQQKELR